MAKQDQSKRSMVLRDIRDYFAAHPGVDRVRSTELTDGLGNTVDYKNCIIIMTSNIGSQHILEYKGKTDSDAYERMKGAVLAEMQHHFRPEFLNRVDEIVILKIGRRVAAIHELAILERAAVKSATTELQSFAGEGLVLVEHRGAPDG